MITAIVFDVDDTLYDLQSPFKEAISKNFPSINGQKTEVMFDTYRYYSDLAFHQAYQENWFQFDYDHYRLGHMLAHFTDIDLRADQTRAFKADYQAALGRIRLFPYMQQLLELLLETNFPRAVLTNGEVDHQSLKIKGLALEKYFDSQHLLISGSTPYHKPDPRLFNLASQIWDFEPSQTLYIGDAYVNDMMGAAKAGWQTLWFNHRRRPLPPHQGPIHNFECETDEEVLNWVNHHVLEA